MSLNELRKENLSCFRCEIAKDRKNLVFGNGSPYSSLFMVGEAPAREEDKQGKPFVGKAGKVLDEVLKASGFDRKQFFITSCLKCKTPNNREPTIEELSNCRYWLSKQLEIIKPDIIIILGAIALKSVLNLSGISGKHGRLIKEGSAVYFISFHPAIALYNPKRINVLIDDFKKLKNMLDSHYKFLKGANPLESKNKQPMGVVNLSKKQTKKKISKPKTKKEKSDTKQTKKSQSKETKTETKPSNGNWIRVANIDRYTGSFKVNQKFKSEFEGAEIQFNIRDVIAFLDGKKDWILLGSDSLSGKEEGKNGIFLNLSQNKKALTFVIDRREAEEPEEPVWYNIPIKAITEFGGQWIGVFRVAKEGEEVKSEEEE